jgi:hypothetical protein
MTTEVFVFGTNIDTDLTSGINDAVTTVSVASVSGFPAIPSGSYLSLTIIHPATAGIFEIVWVTAISGLNLTVLRGQEGSTAQEWVEGDTIYSDVTAGILTNFNNVIQQNSYNYQATDSGSANAYVVALTPAITTYTDGMFVSFNPANTNIGASTFNAGGDAKNITMGGSTLQGGEIVASNTALLQYSSTSSTWNLISGGGTVQIAPGTASGQGLTVSQFNTLKNRIINGDCRVAQRSTVSLPNGTTAYGGPDRFIGINNAVSGTIYQSQASGGSYGSVTTHNFIYLQAISACSGFTGTNYVGGIEQRIEGANCYDLVGQPVVISFIFYATVNGTYSVALLDGTGTNSFVQNFSYTGSGAFQKVVIPVTSIPSGANVPNSSSTGLTLVIGAYTIGTYATSIFGSWQSGSYLCSSTSTNWPETINNEIGATDIQLEKGTVATSFERRSIATEFISCQRYYCEFGTVIVPGYNGPGGGIFQWFTWPAMMRGTPSVSIISPAYTNASTGAVNFESDTGCILQALITSSGAGLMECSVTASAEL